MVLMKPPEASGLPLHRAIVALDIESSTIRPDPVKAELRSKAYELLDLALRTAGIDELYRDPFIDRGDGILALIHPVDQVPKAAVLNQALPALTRLLAEYNTSLPRHSKPQRQLRMRVVVHAGEVHYDVNGCYGETLDVAFRLLDAPPVKKALKATANPLVLVVSQEIYSTVVRRGYDGIDARSFQQLVRVRIGEKRHPGWIYIPMAKSAADHQIHPGTVHVPIPGAALSAVYQALGHRLAETEEPYDVEAGLAALKEWMSAGEGKAHLPHGSRLQLVLPGIEAPSAERHDLV
jgi:hypothetical protein